MENMNSDIDELNGCFEKAYLAVKKMKSCTEEYSRMVEQEYENCSLFFLKSYLEMFKSRDGDECISSKLEKLKLLCEHAYRVFSEYSIDE